MKIWLQLSKNIKVICLWCVWDQGGGRGVLLYLGYIGMCGAKGYCVLAVLVWNGRSTLTIWAEITGGSTVHKIPVSCVQNTPGARRVTCYGTYTVGVNIKRETVLSSIKWWRSSDHPKCKDWWSLMGGGRLQESNHRWSLSRRGPGTSSLWKIIYCMQCLRPSSDVVLLPCRTKFRT